MRGPIQDPNPSPLAGARILVTGPTHGTATLRARLEHDGATVTAMPTIEIRPPEDQEPLDDALRHLHRYDWIAFTSRNAVRAVFDRLQRLGRGGELPTGVRVAAVGSATARELEERGVSPTCVPTHATASSLAAAMREVGVQGASILLPLGDRARPDLAEGLEAGGAQVHAVVAYRTALPDTVDTTALDRLRSGQIDVVAFASPSAAENILALLRSEAHPLSDVRLACIGPTTAAALLALGLEPAVVAEQHTQEGLAVAIRTLYEMEHQHDTA